MILTTANARQVLGVEEYVPQHLSADFFAVLRELLIEDGRAEEATPGLRDGTDLSARLPGTAIVLDTGKPSQEELLVIIAAVGFAALQPATLVAAALKLLQRFRRLRIGLGELSVISVLGRERRTSGEIVTLLNGRLCPTPDAKCVFLRDQRCQIGEANVREVLLSLKERSFVEELPMIEPDVWRFVG
jgi:hypothetical protein